MVENVDGSLGMWETIPLIPEVPGSLGIHETIFAIVEAPVIEEEAAGASEAVVVEEAVMAAGCSTIGDSSAS